MDDLEDLLRLRHPVQIPHGRIRRRPRGAGQLSMSLRRRARRIFATSGRRGDDTGDGDAGDGGWTVSSAPLADDTVLSINSASRRRSLMTVVALVILTLRPSSSASSMSGCWVSISVCVSASRSRTSRLDGAGRHAQQQADVASAHSTAAG